ncbi:MAG TPA: DUF4215 domain-containing protein, partial [Kofleriaceae bacterium]|nr:DUF4215 domain-containing protein [Kofleriaceae bacterium]
GNLIDNDGCDHNCTLPACGNGVVNGTEQCDDGNLTDGDGCDSNCKITRCGNGIQTAGEACDDGNLIDNDGCDHNCTLPACGNGVVNPPEQCDDGNLISGDGCDSNCKITRCGNGVQTAGEACDDGNNINGDTCEADCTLPVCGNGIVDPGEVCDDRNQDACGSCSATCQAVTSAQATGLIFAIQGTDIKPNDAFVVSDGVTSVTFEFSNGTLMNGHVAIPFDPAGTNRDVVANAIKTAIDNSDLQITTALISGFGLVTLQHQRPTSAGNVTITETVNNAAFVVSGMSGGVGGDCPTNLGCASGDDCLSGVCTAARTCE